LNSIKEAHAYCAKDCEAELAAYDTKKPLRLPDGKKLNFGAELFRCPEPLFNPTLLGQGKEGIHQLAHLSIQQRDDSMIKDLYSNIVPSGGSTMFRDFDRRLLKEIKAISQNNSNIKIVPPPKQHPRRYLAWVGGSIMSSCDSFNDICISKDDYNEAGPSIVHRKCF